MIPWGALSGPGSPCIAIALCFLGMGAPGMHGWRADEVSYRIQLPFLVLEGTLQGVEPKGPAGGADGAPWTMAAVFSSMAMAMGVWRARRGAPAWGAARRHASQRRIPTDPKCGGLAAAQGGGLRGGRMPGPPQASGMIMILGGAIGIFRPSPHACPSASWPARCAPLATP